MSDVDWTRERDRRRWEAALLLFNTQTRANMELRNEIGVREVRELAITSVNAADALLRAFEGA